MLKIDCLFRISMRHLKFLKDCNAKTLKSSNCLIFLKINKIKNNYKIFREYLHLLKFCYNHNKCNVLLVRLQLLKIILIRKKLKISREFRVSNSMWNIHNFWRGL